MKKWISIGGGLIVVVMVILVFVGISNLGLIIKGAVNTYGPRITKTEVGLGEVSISIFAAEVELKDFFIGNPRGFRLEKAFRVGAIYLNIDEKTITGDTIIIERIEVVAPEITYEKRRGTDNFQTILNNVNRAIGTDRPSKKMADKKEGGGKKIIIRNFMLKDGRVRLAISFHGEGTISVPLPDIQLRNIGEKKGGVTPAEAFKEIFNVLYSKITSPAVADLLDRELKFFNR